MADLVSIVIPVYNAESFIFETIESILNQTHKELEIIFIDDKSTDRSCEIINRFEDSRIKILTQETNKGQAFALNYGIENSSAEFVAIMHADDLMYPTRIESQLHFLLINANVDIVGSAVETFGIKKETWHYPTTDQQCKDTLLQASPFAHPSVMFRKQRILKYFYYNQDFVPAEDYELWVRIAGNATFANLNERLLKYRLHENQISKLKADDEFNLIKEIRKNLIVRLLNVKELNNKKVLNACYYQDQNPANLNLEGIKLAWNANIKQKFFSKSRLSQFLRFKLKTVLLNYSIFQRISILFRNKELIELLGYKSTISIIFQL